MDNLPNQEAEEEKGRALTREELDEVRAGQDLHEMTQSAGWKVFQGWLEDRAHHSWVDPKGTNAKDEWVWQELNAFHSADVARQLIEDVNTAVNRSLYLGDVASGKVVEGRRMKI